MAYTSANDITIVLSGGTININSDNSLGGDPSSTPIVSAVLNNLFSDVTPEQSKEGTEDYRCIYLFNDGLTPVYSVALWIDDLNEDLGSMAIGFVDLDETKRLTLSGGITTGGSFTLSYLSTEFTVDYDSDLAIWASNFQTALDELMNDDEPYFQEATVIAANAGSGAVIFDIKFTGLDGSRSFDDFVIVSNDLLPSDTINMLITVPEAGSPINSIASEINVATTPPGGVEFSVTTEQSPLTLPSLANGEGFPLWVKRTIPAGTAAQHNDGFTLRFRALSLAP